MTNELFSCFSPSLHFLNKLAAVTERLSALASPDCRNLPGCRVLLQVSPTPPGFRCSLNMFSCWETCIFNNCSLFPLNVPGLCCWQVLLDVCAFTWKQTAEGSKFGSFFFFLLTCRRLKTCTPLKKCPNLFASSQAYTTTVWVSLHTWMNTNELWITQKHDSSQLLIQSQEYCQTEKKTKPLYIGHVWQQVGGEKISKSHFTAQSEDIQKQMRNIQRRDLIR